MLFFCGQRRAELPKSSPRCMLPCNHLVIVYGYQEPDGPCYLVRSTQLAVSIEITTRNTGANLTIDKSIVGDNLSELRNIRGAVTDL